MAIKVKGCTVVDDIRNITAGVSTVTTGCVTGTFTGATVCGGTVCATTGFSGSGANITGIPASNISGLSGGGGAQTFTSPGTFPVPPGTTTLKITATGGGANGCPSTQPGFNGAQDICPGAGGDSALTHVKYLSVPPSCSSYPVTVGGAGGNTIFGGPTVFLAGGAPDPASCGKPAQANYVLSTPVGSSNGINKRVDTYGTPSLYGRGGFSGSSSNGTPGCPGCPGAYGAGGGGAFGLSGCRPAACIVPGGSGAPGFVIVEW